MRLISRQESKINSAKDKIKRYNRSGCQILLEAGRQRRPKITFSKLPLTGQGVLSIVGIGPGNTEFLTQKARETIKNAELIVGYTTYINLLKDLINQKEIFSSCMAKEIERARFAIKKALEGKKVCLVSSGDPGVYAMAGLILELLKEEDYKKLNLEIIPGVMAVNAAASILGAPLMNDFALISLSDILTDTELIRKRIEKAAQGDFVIVFYNPKSKKRIEPLKYAWEILIKRKRADTPVGIVRNAKRNNQETIITNLKDMLKFTEKIDMLTVIIIGNSETYIKDNYMITPRGYRINKTKNNA